MVNEFFFVFTNSSFQFVYHAVNGSVHIFLDVLAVDGSAVNARRCFSFVLKLFYGQDTLDVRHDVKMSSDLIYLGADIVSHGFGYFDMMA